jgi:NAD(P)-dependent dehydrogenase (short-subunit alcohol dehydrogenase family)
LFKTALQKYGHIDHAVANAGIIEQGLWFEPKGGLEGVKKEPGIGVLNVSVNLKGVMYFARIACAYLAHEQDPNAPTDKSLTFLSSVAGLKGGAGHSGVTSC